MHTNDKKITKDTKQWMLMHTSDKIATKDTKYCSGTEVSLVAPTIQLPGNGPANPPREEGGASYLPDVTTQANPKLGQPYCNQSVLFVRLTCTQLLH